MADCVAIARRWSSRSAALAALLTQLSRPAEVRASSLTVPDDVATVQLALDAGVDTVLVRAASYPESLVVSAQVCLIGIPGDAAFERPVVADLTFQPNVSSQPNFTVRGIESSGRLHLANWVGLYATILFEDCALRDGVFDDSEFPGTQDMILRGCRIDGDVGLYAGSGYLIDSCVVHGQVLVQNSDSRLTVVRSEFHGSGLGVAVGSPNSEIGSATITHTLIEGYRAGIGVATVADLIDVENNIVRDCDFGVGVRSDFVRIVENTLQRCGTQGIGVEGYGVDVEGNSLANCGTGIVVAGDLSGTVSRNVVWGGTGNGIEIHAGGSDALSVKNNTCSRNSGSGFQWTCPVASGFELTGNIGSGNGRFGISWEVPELPAAGCNDWFGNALGDVSGQQAAGTDFSFDPAFCDVSGGDLHLPEGSPLIDRPGCGMVGALGAGCAVTDAPASRIGTFRLGRLGPNPARGAVRIEFELPHAASVELALFDAQGRRVGTLARGEWPAGVHAVQWPASAGSEVAPGVYQVRYRHPGGDELRRLVRIR